MEYNIRDKYIVKQPVAGPSFADDDDEAPDGAMNDDNRESSTAKVVSQNPLTHLLRPSTNMPSI